METKPLLVFWETTKACKHCRAEAIEKPLPGELSTEEAYRPIDMVTEFGKPYPILVLTGEDPLLRRDIRGNRRVCRWKRADNRSKPAVTPLLKRKYIG